MGGPFSGGGRQRRQRRRRATRGSLPLQVAPRPCSAPCLSTALCPLLYPQIVKLKAFSKFENTTEALSAAASLVDSKLSKGGWVVCAC